VVQLDVTDKVRKQILLELRALYHSSSPHIIKFYGAFFSEGHIFIALELMDAGSLHDVLKKTGAMPENVVSKIAHQVCSRIKSVYFN
jgi:serine/threonine protein kinase